MKKSKVLFVCILLVTLPRLWAVDFGLLLDQTAGFGGYGSDTSFDYSGILIPRFSALLGDNGDLFISAGLRAEYQDEFVLLPELLRTELVYRFGDAELRAGRMQYSDPLGFIAEGLFDGARFSMDTDLGTFSIGVWYTGLLYKKRANITMTAKESQANFVKLNYSDFCNTYFAPQRVFSALDWEHPLIAELFRVNAGVLGQFDLSGENKLHSQYFSARVTAPVSAFVISLGGCLELVEAENKDIGIGLAGELAAAWILPTVFSSRLSFLGRFSGGAADNSSITAFLPLTTQNQGEILKAKLSGLSMLSLDYTARILPSLSASLAASYFIRSDLGTYVGFGTEGYFLGPEFFGRLLWGPVSDLQMSLGGGVFIPALGNAAPGADMLWRVELGVIVSLY